MNKAQEVDCFLVFNKHLALHKIESYSNCLDASYWVLESQKLYMEGSEIEKTLLEMIGRLTTYWLLVGTRTQLPADLISANGRIPDI